MRIRILFRIQLIKFYADPDPNFYWMRMQVTKMMRILVDPDPQHCLFFPPHFPCRIHNIAYFFPYTFLVEGGDGAG